MAQFEHYVSLTSSDLPSLCMPNGGSACMWRPCQCSPRGSQHYDVRTYTLRKAANFEQWQHS